MLTREELIQSFFYIHEESKCLLVNPEVPALDLQDEREAAGFLVDLICFWKIESQKRNNHVYHALFCTDQRIERGEDNWFFRYKVPSLCGRCVRGQEIIEKVFGSCAKFNRLPFVSYSGEREYTFSLDLLKYFAENGHESTVRLIEERKQEVARKKAKAEAEEQNAKLTERLGDKAISEDLKRQILPHIDNDSLVIASPDVAVVKTSRSEWGSGGGIGYYDQVRVFYGNQADMKEWQWRDRYSARNDKPWLEVHAIGKVDVFEKDNKVIVEVELVNSQHRNRTATYTFNPPKPTAVRTLSVDEQVAFTAQVENEVARVMSELNRLWELKPTMPPSQPGSGGQYVSYRRPSIKQREFRPEIGVAAFVTEEQIDHRVTDLQIRHELYVLTMGSEKAERKAEDHGYGREGGALLVILEVTPERIMINTKSGKLTTPLK